MLIVGLSICSRRVMPAEPIRLLTSTSSSAIDCDTSHAFFRRRFSGIASKVLQSLLTAQPRFMAVGLVAINVRFADSIEVSEASSLQAKAIPKAALMPINGAPLTCIFLIANSI